MDMHQLMVRAQALEDQAERWLFDASVALTYYHHTGSVKHLNKFRARKKKSLQLTLIATNLKLKAAIWRRLGIG